MNDVKPDTLFHEYYSQWLVIYKEGSVRLVTMQKYRLTESWVKQLIPDVKLCDLDRITYQQLINDYAETHERQTTMDFHHQLKLPVILPVRLLSRVRLRTERRKSTSAVMSFRNCLLIST